MVSISDIQVRADISPTFMAHSSTASQNLQLSGLEGSFFKIHADHLQKVDHYLVWLPEQTSLATCRKMLEGLEHLGLACKRRIPPHRFAARFANELDVKAFCAKLKLEDTTKLGR